MKAFCDDLQEQKFETMFIVDGTNTLDDELNDRESDSKAHVRRLLDGITKGHIKVSSSTANYRASKHNRVRNVELME